MEKVCCGGFYLGEGLELDGRTLKATGGSSPVPDPEAADIGKVLGIVEDGAGAKFAPVAASGGAFICTFTMQDDEEGNTHYICDKTVSEILDARNTMPVIAKLYQGEGAAEYYYTLNDAYDDGEYSRAAFSYASIPELYDDWKNFRIETIIWDYDTNEWKMVYVYSARVPAFQDSDEGKILKIVDGQPQWVNP